MCMVSLARWRGRARWRAGGSAARAAARGARARPAAPRSAAPARRPSSTRCGLHSRKLSYTHYLTLLVHGGFFIINIIRYVFIVDLSNITQKEVLTHPVDGEPFAVVDFISEKDLLLATVKFLPDNLISVKYKRNEYFQYTSVYTRRGRAASTHLCTSQ